MTTVDEAMKHFEMRAGCEPNTCLVLAMLLLFCRPSVFVVLPSSVCHHRPAGSSVIEEQQLTWEQYSPPNEAI